MNTCRFCYHSLSKTFIDLGTSPLSNAYLMSDELSKKEIFYPLHAQMCEKCFLVQVPEFESPENIFSDYAYFSSYSDSWLQHSKFYTEEIIKRFSIDKNWLVIEIGSNDGYLLQYFKDHRIPILGIEPAVNVAKIALEKNLPTINQFFGKKLAKEMKLKGCEANLLIANNVLAHVPNLNDFVAGLKMLLAENGILTLEFHHLLRLIECKQFDTIYHEHFSYFSLLTAVQVFERHKLTIFDVEELSVHGGSLRIYVKHSSDITYATSKRVSDVLKKEKNFGLDNLDVYLNFVDSAKKIKNDLIKFLTEVKKSGQTIVGYGAPAKGNTLLNYCNVSSDLLPFTVDKNPHKQHRFLPGTHIPILNPDEVYRFKPNYLLVLPWNLKDEICVQMSDIKKWDGKFVLAIPEFKVI